MGYRNLKKQKNLFFFQIEDFDFSMSQDNAYYQFFKNAPKILKRLNANEQYAILTI